MKLIIRGHIRTAFHTPALLHFVETLCSIVPELSIYIHTWDIVANSISWRRVAFNPTRVTESLLYSYFESVRDRIRYIQIDCDEDIPLIGQVRGHINGGPMPLRGWKNYWYGQYSVLAWVHALDETSPESVLNMRFDVLNNSASATISKDRCLDFIWKHAFRTDFTENVFLFDDEAHYGIDNLFIGNIHTQYRLAHHFHTQMDSILKRHKDTIHQEYLVFRANLELFRAEKDNK